MNDSLSKFINQNNGKLLDWDGVYGPQCVDLIRFYQRDTLHVPPEAIPAAPTAKQMFNNFPNAGNQYFTKILNGPTNFPSRGDIVFWGYYPFITGTAGHVAICSNADPYWLITFDQNYGNPNFCKYVNHNYRGIMGWLHPKK